MLNTNNMNIITSDDFKFDIYNNQIKIYNNIPLGFYEIMFDRNKGFYLQKSNDITIPDNYKIYGDYLDIISHIIRVYEYINKNLGVIFTGNKGLGKTLVSRKLCTLLVKKYPIILVNNYYDGIENFIRNINQKCVLLFDEFDKNFSTRNRYTYNNTIIDYCVPYNSENEDDMVNSNLDVQSRFLTLFDGIDQGNKLFIITCNSIYNLNKYYINRPGRFHFKIDFKYPNIKDIKEYLQDKIKPEYYNQIKDIITFSYKINLNYDSLDAIALELNMGSKFNDIIKYLNINKDSCCRYNIIAKIKNLIFSSQFIERSSKFLSNFEIKLNCNELHNASCVIIFNINDFIPYKDDNSAFYVYNNKIKINNFQINNKYYNIDKNISFRNNDTFDDEEPTFHKISSKNNISERYNNKSLNNNNNNISKNNDEEYTIYPEDIEYVKFIKVI